MTRMRGRLHMPPLDGATGWLNTTPPGPPDLRGRVVLVQFWTLTCINWLRQEPYVRAWSHAYRDDGLVVVGVHTPEFSFEHDADRVRRAAARHGIGHPVAIDSGYAIWDAFANHVWPALFFVDADGRIRDEHGGEGRYAESERVLQRLLGVEREPVAVAGTGVEAEADWEHLRTPETYLGYGRGTGFASPGGATFDGPGRYELPARLRLNTWGLSGAWTIGREMTSSAQPGARLAHRFHARDAHAVLARSAPEPVPFRVLVDGAPPGAAHGVDVDADGHGMLDDGRLYSLVREPGAVRERTLEVELSAAGAQAYALTFG